MSAIPERVTKVLQQYSLVPREFDGVDSCATSVAAAATLGVEVGQIAKSLLFKGAKANYIMVVMAGDAKIANGKIKQLAGSQVSMTSFEETREVTGYEVGGVCPFDIDASRVSIYVDDSLKRYDMIYPSCGTRNSCVGMDYATLSAITGGKTCDIAKSDT